MPPKEEYTDSESGLEDGPVKTLISQEDNELIDIKASQMFDGHQPSESATHGGGLLVNQNGQIELMTPRDDDNDDNLQDYNYQSRLKPGRSHVKPKEINL